MAFFGGTWSIVLFVLRPDLLNAFGSFFGVARWADLIVYMSIIGLLYMYFELLHKISRRDIERTTLIRSLALYQAQWAITDPNIVFLIPMYGEDVTALETVRNVLAWWHSVVCIDDGNNKIDIAAWLKKELASGSCVYIPHPMNMWQWAALQTGAEYVMRNLPDTKHVVHFDADGQHRLEDLEQYMQAFANDPSLDIVLWSRFLWTAKDIGRWRYFHKKLQVLFMRVFVGLRLTDTNNGYRVIKASVLPKLRITLNGMAHASEIEHMIKVKKLHYVEVPVTILYTEYSVAKGQKLGNATKIVKDLFYSWFFYK